MPIKCFKLVTSFCRGGMMNELKVRIANATEQEALMDILTLSFSTDPCTRYIWAKADVYIASLRRFAVALGGGALAHGTGYIADDGAAAALWLPPGVESDGDAIGVLIEQTVPADKRRVIGEVVEGMGKYHPHEPHWYLALIGADPVRQGNGFGSALLKEALKRCDSDGVIAYLESSNPKNVPLYERHGFEVIGVIQPDDFPPLIPMLRRAGG